jgi:curli biogenesis system outer membrane secretion channel CsgG
VLSSSPNFIVADRETLAEIGQEHKLAQIGATDPRNRPAKGQMAGPRYLIKVDVTEFKEDVAGRSKGGRFELGAFTAVLGALVPNNAKTTMKVLTALNPTIGGAKETVHGLVGIDLRVVDVDTAAVVRATRASSSLTRENSRTIFGVGGFSTTDNKFSQSVVAKAMRLAVQDAVVQIHSILRERAVAQLNSSSASVLAQQTRTLPVK